MIQKLIKEVPRAIIISVSVFLVLVVIRLISGINVAVNKDLVINFGYTFLYGFALYFANAILFIYLDTIFKAERFTKRRILIGFLGSFVISILVIFLLRIFEDVIIQGTNFSDFIKNEGTANYLVAIILTFFITLAFHAFYFYTMLLFYILLL